MATDQGPVVQSAVLRGELIRLRREAGLTQERVASDLEWSPSKLIRVEGGRSSITKVDLDALLTKYGVTSERARERLQALNRGARERGWWDRYRDDVSPTYLNYVGFEAGAAFIRQFQSGFLPGLLPDRWLRRGCHRKLSRPGPGRGDSRAPAPASVRAGATGSQASSVLHQWMRPSSAGMSESPKIRPSCRDQLREHSRHMAEQDDLVTVRVIPFEAGAHRGLYGPFTLLEFDGGLSDLLYIDAGRGEFASMMQGDDPPDRGIPGRL